MIFMVRNTEKVCYDPEFDKWFIDHPCYPEYIFAPIKWIKQKLKTNSNPQEQE